MARLNPADRSRNPAARNLSPLRKSVKSEVQHSVSTEKAISSDEREGSKRAKHRMMATTIASSAVSSRTRRELSQKPTASKYFNIHADQYLESKIQECSRTRPSTGCSNAAETRLPSPLKLTQVNSQMIPLSRLEQVKQMNTLESDDDCDKENRLVDDEAEEDLIEEPEECSGEESGGASDDSLEEENWNASGPFESRKMPRHGTNHRSSMRSSRLFTETGDTEAEEPGEDESDNSDDFNFVVSDNEDISYHDFSDDLPDDDELDEMPPPPRPRRRLLRGRKPEAKKEKTQLEDESSFRSQPSWPKHLEERCYPPNPDSIYPCSLPKEHIQDRTKHLVKTNGAAESDINTLNDSQPDSPGKKNRKEITASLFEPPMPHLQSPSKERNKIPPSPHRESVDSFWSQELTNDWNDKHSPKKEKLHGRALERLLRAFGEDAREIQPSTSSDEMTPKSPSKTALKKAETEHKKAILERKRAFDNRKTVIAEDFLNFLDNRVSEGQVQKLAEQTGGVKIVWSKTLQTTAGRAHWKQERIFNHGPAELIEWPLQQKPEIKHYARIELAQKIIDSEDRLLNTLTHEYCHLANMMISKVRDNPHGASFKEWARKCTDTLRDHPEYCDRVKVSTKHTYKINYKYVWLCAQCGQDYGRHSKSIDTSKSRCGLCKGVLHQIKPKPRNVGNSPPKKTGFMGQKLEDVMKSVGDIHL